MLISVIREKIREHKRELRKMSFPSLTRGPEEAGRNLFRSIREGRGTRDEGPKGVGDRLRRFLDPP